MARLQMMLRMRRSVGLVGAWGVGGGVLWEEEREMGRVLVVGQVSGPRGRAAVGIGEAGA
jgi:hypothetical protein